MVIWLLLTALGAVLIISGAVCFVAALIKRSRVGIIVSILVPALYVIGYGVLLELDRRFIAEETRKNGGEPPEWVW